MLRVDDGDGIFLDVVWLSKILNPILDHNLHDMILPNAQLNTWRGKLVNTGVLCWGFARCLWGDVFREDILESSLGELEKALFDVLVKLGVIIPLGRSNLSPIGGSAWPSFHEGGDLPDMLVLRWLRLRLSASEQVQLNTLLEEKLQEGAKEVTLKWLFDSAGPPHGLIGRLMASCHVIGEPETGLCWRDGALFKGHFVASEADRPYVVVVNYNSEDRVLSVKVFGPVETKRVWIALRYMASLMVNVSKEWSGLLWEGWLECAKHPRDRVQLATPTEVGVEEALCCGWLTAVPVHTVTVCAQSNHLSCAISPPFLPPFYYVCILCGRRGSANHCFLRRAVDVTVCGMLGECWARQSLGWAT